MQALIGSTGFVGRALIAQRRIDVAVSSVGVEVLTGARPERLYCAGAPAEKWRANADPLADLQSIERLIASLQRIRAQQIVLLSTIDVYPCQRDSDEDHADMDAPNHAYGRHRLLLERAVRQIDPDALIVRLPALYGAGLKKNALFDLIHRRALDALDPRANFQWYGLERLSADIDRATECGLTLVNLFPAPLNLGQLASAFFPDVMLATRDGPAADYALRTKHAAAFGGRAGFLADRGQVLTGLARFLNGAG
jgi:hypothetical protein